MTLRGKRILITRQLEQSTEFVSEIEKHGGRAVVFPMIKITDPDSWDPCDRVLQNLHAYTALLFTSMNAVAKFFQRCTMKGVDIHRFPAIKIYAVGARTRSAVESHHLKVTFIPEQYSSKTLGRHFTTKSVREQKFLFPRGNLGREELTDLLRKNGAGVDAVVVYNNVEPDDSSAKPLWDLLVSEPIDVVTFASPSAAKRFARLIPAERMRQLNHPLKVAVIGPTTEEEVRKLGFAPDIVATESTVQGLVRAISAYWRSSI